MTNDITSSLKRVGTDRRGAVAILVAIAMIAIIGVCAIVVDVGYIYTVRRQLQSATDQAALAGAQKIYDGTAISEATTYSATTGNKNVNSNVTVSMVSGYPQLKCLTSTGVTCYGSPSANAILVVQQASVPLFFARIFGRTTATITTQALASAAGSQPKPYNVMMVLDTTASMNSTDSACGLGSSATRLDCAKAGVRLLLQGFYPDRDKVGLMVFPGVKNATSVGYEYDCSSSTVPTIVAYNASPVYTLLSLGNDYRADNNPNTPLTTTSNLVRAVGGGGSGCTAGMKAVGGVGTYFADAITAAQAALTTASVTGTQNVMIVLSDGDANASSSNMPSGKVNDQCQQAVDAADAAATAGTWVYSVAYGASTSSTGSCSTDSPHISACTTMQNIASDSKKFYADTAGGSTCTSSANPVTALVSIFGKIQSSLSSVRLLPDNTT